MRDLGRPDVLKSALLAGGLTALACYPRVADAPGLRYPVWYLETLLCLGSIVLWAFVFAWHTEYSGRPVFTLHVGWRSFALATVLGVTVAAIVSMGDPALRARTPHDYPSDLGQWFAMALFSLAFTELFLVFAPLAWLLRLSQRVGPAVLLTVVFGLFVLAAKNRAPPTPMPPGIMVGLVAYRICASLISVYLFLRGGLLLSWWWGLLIQSRHLFHLTDWAMLGG